MNMSLRRARTRFGLIGSLALALSLLLPAGAVLADTERGHRGRVGSHELTDKSGTPGVTCIFNSHGRLKTFVVRGPTVWARDTSAGADSQKVGWRAVIQRRYSPGSPWRNFSVSPVFKAAAGDEDGDVDGYDFLAWRGSPTLSPNDQDYLPGTDYRVRIKMFWYRPNGRVDGKATHSVDWYRWKGKSYTSGPGGGCPAWYFIV